MKIKIKRTEEYIPELDGNRDADNPVVITIKHLTVAEKEDCWDYVAQVLDIDGDVVTPARYAVDPVKLFKHMVIGVTNLSIEDENGKVVECKRGNDILKNPGYNMLYLELVPVLIGIETRINEKN